MRGPRPRPMRTSYDSSATLRRLIGTRITLAAGLPRLQGRQAAHVVVHELALRAVVEGAGDEALGGLDRQVGHLTAELLHRLLLLVLHLPLPLLHEVLRLLARLGQDLGPLALRLALPLLEDARGLAPRLGQDLLVPAQGLLPLGAGLLGLLQR